MSDSPQQTEDVEIPRAYLEKRPLRSSQLIWLIPIIAAIIGISLAIKAYQDRGPVITITFKNGEGIEAGKTRIKYKDVQIGEVKSITISKDRMHVVVTAELNKGTDELLVDDTRFWVVTPRITGASVTGLSTLMGGSFIGLDAGTSKKSCNSFKGLEDPPVVRLDETGRQFVLHAADIGSLNVSSPIYFRHLQVGEVIAYELDKDGKGLTLKVFIRSPYDRFVKANTLFWHSSGIDFSLDANGLRINSESMVSLLLGGITFQTPEDSLETPAAQPNAVFTLFTNKDEAMKRPDTVMENYLLVFRESLRGLSIGAPVDLRGVTVGEVTKINIELEPHRKQFAMPVEIKFYPERLKARYRNTSRTAPPMNSRKLLDSLVEHGFRAQLRTGSLITGQLYITLDMFPNAPRAKMDWSKNPPEFPTITGTMEQFQTALMQVLQKIDKLPVEDLAGDARKTIQTLDTTLKSADKLLNGIDTAILPEAKKMVEDIRTTLGDVRKTLDDARKTLGSATQTLSADAPLQQDLRDALKEMNRAAQALRTLGDYLERHPESLIRGKKEGE